MAAEERERGNVRTITAAARERLIKWQLAQWASAQRSWWRRERMGFDSRERDGREDVRGCISKDAGMQRGTSVERFAIRGILCIGCGKGWEDGVLQ